MIAMPDREAWIFSLKSFIGAMLALYLSFRLGLPRPFWAPLTAYVVAQPIAGAVRSKALYRVIGTFIGALATVIFIPTFINYSVLMCLVFGDGSVSVFTCRCSTGLPGLMPSCCRVTPSP